MADEKYCLCCDEIVPYNKIERNEKRELTCVYCGFTLDVQKLWETSRAREGHALVAEDSQSLKDVIIKALSASGFSKNISAFSNGLELITAYSKLLSDKTPIDIAIIDLNMPVMDGLTAARTIRAMESQHKAPTTPIVFFSAVKADNFLKSQMELLGYTSYMNKGSDTGLERLAERVEQLIGYLKEMYPKN
jgi:CheY-like chemotaxis protein